MWYVNCLIRWLATYSYRKFYHPLLTPNIPCYYHSPTLVLVTCMFVTKLPPAHSTLVRYSPDCDSFLDGLFVCFCFLFNDSIEFILSLQLEDIPHFVLCFDLELWDFNALPIVHLLQHSSEWVWIWSFKYLAFLTFVSQIGHITEITGKGKMRNLIFSGVYVYEMEIFLVMNVLIHACSAPSQRIGDARHDAGKSIELPVCVPSPP